MGNPNQPRVPKGSPDVGQFAGGGGSGGSGRGKRSGAVPAGFYRAKSGKIRAGVGRPNASQTSGRAFYSQMRRDVSEGGLGAAAGAGGGGANRLARESKRAALRKALTSASSSVTRGDGYSKRTVSEDLLLRKARAATSPASRRRGEAPPKMGKLGKFYR